MSEKNKKYFSKSLSLLFITGGFLFLLFSACEKNDINVKSADINGTTTGSSSGTSGTSSSSSTSSTTGTTTCNPPLNSISFSTASFNNYTVLSTNPTVISGHYALHDYNFYAGNYRNIDIVFPGTLAPACSSCSYVVYYNYWLNSTLNSGQCAVRFYEVFTGGHYNGYALSGGVVNVTVASGVITAAFCNLSCVGWDGNNVSIPNFTATGKISN